jgi:hydrogenase maturation protein HypF
MAGLRIHVRGTVQGVGFRPFVFRLAERHGLTGWVRNTAGQVEIDVDGSSATLETFVRELRTHAPEVARIDEVVTMTRPAAGYDAFAILVSHADDGWQAVSPDIATCDDCLAELLDPTDRRYRYPFTNCTNCGPRFTIIEALPYDRARTTMRHFPMCDECRREFENPSDRRFHAQPIACHTCGPKVWLHIPDAFVPDGDPIAQCADLLRSGKIVAVKGLGGFHLACDATNEEAVARLRERKQRYGKPLAIMVRSTEDAELYIEVAEDTRRILEHRERPIVVARAITRSYARTLPRSQTRAAALARSLTAGVNTIGVMLPYTPLHHLLLKEAGVALVMTSGNLSEEPIATGNAEALTRLADVADAFLLHNRDIYSRYDDSVMRVGEAGTIPLRRARSMAPAPIALPFTAAADILAVGPQQKGTFCLVKESKAFVSQHLGDLDNVDNTDAYRETLDLYTRLFKVQPAVIAHDLHPDYWSTQLAHELAEPGIVQVAVQHHHAHVVSCMVEHGVREPVIGIAYDGTGYGTDGAVWGSEFLVATWHGFERAAHLRYTPLIGGEAAVRNPLRMAASHLWSAALREGSETDFGLFFARLSSLERAVWQKQFESGLNAPPTSSCGRLFDAVAALLGIRSHAVYEGQPAVELEAIADGAVEQRYAYDVASINNVWVIDPARTFYEVWRDIGRGRPASEIAAAFHNTVAAWTIDVAGRIRDATHLNAVCLSGGCFQNELLTARVLAGMRASGFEIFTHALVPPNDGGVALGQAAVAWALTQK